MVLLRCVPLPANSNTDSRVNIQNVNNVDETRLLGECSDTSIGFSSERNVLRSERTRLLSPIRRRFSREVDLGNKRYDSGLLHPVPIHLSCDILAARVNSRWYPEYSLQHDFGSWGMRVRVTQRTAASLELM